MRRRLDVQIFYGLSFIAAGLLILAVNFRQAIWLELGYEIKKNFLAQNEKGTRGVKQLVTPFDNWFAIIIPKINVNSKVIPNIDPFNKSEYKEALTKGVAHAKGTAVPGSDGNIFIFSHSTAIGAEVLKYNARFYLLGKLEPGDEIYLFYKGLPYLYSVKVKRIIDPSEIQFLQNTWTGKTLTLMTCWPAGTTLKRLIVISERKEI